MSCTGSEASIQDYPHAGWEQNRLRPDTRGYVYGVVQVYYKGQWGTVCDDSWGWDDAKVACRQLGFSKAVGYWHSGRGEGPVWLDDMACTGSETSLHDCPHRGWGVHNCGGHTEDAGVVCSGAQNVQTELCHKGQWGTVCDDSFGWDDAKVACRQLGFSKAVHYRHGGGGEGPVWLDDMACTGSETSLQDCPHRGWGVHNCGGHTEDAGVLHAIQVYYNGRWGTVCDDSWHMNDVKVACRQLDYAKTVSYWRYNGQGEGPVWLNDMRCTGSEASLLDCRHPGWGVVSSNCNGHTYDVSCIRGHVFGVIQVYYKGQWGTVCDDSWGFDDAKVACRQLGFTKAIDYWGNGRGEGPLESVDGLAHILPVTSSSLLSIDKRQDTRGYVKDVMQVYYNGQWGTVCDDYWRFDDAKVACRQLGFTKAVDYWGGGRGEGPVWLDEMRCTGSEASLQDCPHNGWGVVSSNCNGHTEDVYVQYSGSSSDQNCFIVMKYFVTYLRDTRGYVKDVMQVYYNGQWGTVCEDSWDIYDAKVACRQLGYATTVNYWHNGQGEGPVWLDDMRCTGSEASLLDCRHPGWGVVSSNCNGHTDDNCGGHVRGVIQVHYNGQWGTVCDDDWDGYDANIYYKGQWGTVCHYSWGLDDAKVACRQLGFTKAVDYWGDRRGEGPVWLDDVRCTGSEASLHDCPHAGWGVVSSNCNGHTEDLYKGLKKKTDFKKVPAKQELSVVALSAKSDRRGHVKDAIQVYYNGQWGTVCDDSWNMNDAKVACRQLGYAKAANYWWYNGQGEGPVWLDDMRCTGSEASLLDCPHPGWGVVSSNCVHTDDVLVFQHRKLPLLRNTRVHVRAVIPVHYNGQWGTACDDYWNGNDAKVACRQQWGTVCDDSWGSDDAKVACRQLGFTKAVYYGYSGRGEGPVWLDEMRCTGSEASLQDCPHNGWGVVSSNCNGHTEDAYDVIQVYYNGQWGTVCEDFWGSDNAKVACRQLGLTKAVGSGGGELGEGPVWLDDMRCTGSEASLQDCPHAGWGIVSSNCNGHTRDVYVQCSGSSSNQNCSFDM
ncbi:deleted in malignant brain tumors 1 protein-like [Actinia tenebrosa]|uniref:Deleted in malignant brain tumors 1 protein-like n=1 Tax=Actinia tenebrosa TaxID=6105 RepID=A0A6P8HV86_ACTTE|nr:deleted in malignant brain tumors 1 protein-like [Actinia tenebrosa]